jgi:hypothetical protein
LLALLLAVELSSPSNFERAEHGILKFFVGLI